MKTTLTFALTVALGASSSQLVTERSRMLFVSTVLLRMARAGSRSLEPRRLCFRTAG
jgi:hypothetical protein